MTETVDTQIFKGDDPTLSFNERMKLASSQKEKDQKERDIKKRAEAEDLLITVDKFISELVLVDTLSNKFIEAVIKTHTKRKVIELFTFNTNTEYGELYNRELPSATIEGKVYPIRYILNETYQGLIRKYFPEKVKSLKDIIYEKINVPEFHDGVDLETGEKLIVCIFLYKKPNSKFKNGIYISRDGIDYNSSYIPKPLPKKNN